ncbi:carboxypeptidase-like regulatory domain-containing protein [Hymenobacter sp. BRD128]|uniref:carboxypeptidase-like regulatory domain-containing protein n=1 Tax=Hymenobacter sp. BRD128 TaxID=2675878 RepID=UPI0015677C29|nr:carboxypeptidase-like regulatory domain-containing protein [Hymenobacter sp. BRD128]QKG56419.1 carboxypeptidase-like regulatory domain-containing protein [Hymenobacter sp. BRD128]
MFLFSFSASSTLRPRLWPGRGLTLFFLVLLGLPGLSRAQRVVSGQVVEAATGEPVPFASVFIPHTAAGVTADLAGKFRLVVAGTADSIAASALGFVVGRRALTAEAAQTVLLRLKAGGGVALGEVVVSSRQPENPAFRILREVQKHKPQNERSALTAAEFDSYNRTEVALADIPKGLAKRKVVQDIRALAVRRGAAAAADPDAPLPVFAAEVGSRVYQQYASSRRREDIRHRQLRGVGPREGSVLAQLLGGNLQTFDFYPNWQNLLSKDFISPIAEGGVPPTTTSCRIRCLSAGTGATKSA